MGKFGGVRAAVQLKSMASEIGTLVCSYNTCIAEAHRIIDAEGNEIPGSDEKSPITESFVIGRGELATVAQALCKERKLMEERKKSKAKM